MLEQPWDSKIFAGLRACGPPGLRASE
ncbi:MAG: hypothetical protein QOC73_1101, partial [Actinomycetota bacterium]|nr:hypothetical protein [Actinomycetota bacterium]